MSRGLRPASGFSVIVTPRRGAQEILNPGKQCQRGHPFISPPVPCLPPLRGHELGMGMASLKHPNYSSLRVHGAQSLRVSRSPPFHFLEILRLGFVAAKWSRGRFATRGDYGKVLLDTSYSPNATSSSQQPQSLTLKYVPFCQAVPGRRHAVEMQGDPL